MQILIVDDRAEDLYTLESALDSNEYSLVKANSGEKALKYLLEHEPALILMDVQMPGLDGYQTAALIKDNQRTKEIPIIFMTAELPEEQFLEKGYQLGAVDYLYKPFNPNILKSKITVFVELARKTQRLLQTERRERALEIAQLELKSLRREQLDQKKYRALIEGINYGIVWSMNPCSYNTTFASPSAETLTGFPTLLWTDEPQLFFERFFPEEREAFIEKLRQLKDPGQGMTFDHRFICADGTIRWMHTGVRLLEVQESMGPELQGLSVDVTRMKKVELKLKKSQTKSEALASASLSLSNLMDPKEFIFRLGRFFVPTLADWCSVHWVDDNHQPTSPTYISSTEEIHKKIEATGWPVPYWVKTVVESEKSYFRKDQNEGAHSLISVIAIPLITRDHLWGVLSFVTLREDYKFDEEDLIYFEEFGRRVVTALENVTLLQETKRAVKVRDDFLSIASHELKTPLTSLMLQLQMLKKKLNIDSENQEEPNTLQAAIRFALKQVDSLNKLIEELLDVSRIRSGNLNLKPEYTNIVELIFDTVDSLKDQIGRSKCTISIASDDQVTGFWDKFRIRQVLSNLILNSTKYAAGSQIEVKVESSVFFNRKKGATLRVKDNGPGIPMTHHKLIFERFERGSSSKEISGLGLGLYIAKKIIEAHKGRISLQSSPGEGVEFIIELPSFEGSPKEISSPSVPLPSPEANH